MGIDRWLFIRLRLLFWYSVSCLSGNCLLLTVFLFWCWQTYRQTFLSPSLSPALWPCHRFDRYRVCGGKRCVLHINLRVCVYVCSWEVKVVRGWGGGVSLHGTKVFPPSEQTPQQETRFEWHDHIRHQEVKVMESLWRPQSQDLVTLATRGQTVCKAVSSERSTEVWSIKRGCTAALSKSKSLWAKIKNRDEVTFG